MVAGRIMLREVDPAPGQYDIVCFLIIMFNGVNVLSWTFPPNWNCLHHLYVQYVTVLACNKGCGQQNQISPPNVSYKKLYNVIARAYEEKRACNSHCKLLQDTV